MSIDGLQEKIRKLKNPTMLALDPTREVVPQWIVDQAVEAQGPTPEALASAYETYCLSLLEALVEIIPAVKVQNACWSALGAPWVAAMQRIMEKATELGYYVVLDTMRGDVPHIATLSAQGLFEGIEIGGKLYRPYPCDGITINGYLGTDSIQPFLPYCKEGKASLFVVIRTSNKSSMEVQDLMSGGRLVHTAMADLVNRWGRDQYGKFGYASVAAVVGMNQPQAMESMRKKYDRVFFLVAGYGAQGGGPKNAQYAFDRFGHGAIITAGRSILAAWKKEEGDGKDYVSKAKSAAVKMRKDLGKYVQVL